MIDNFRFDLLEARGAGAMAGVDAFREWQDLRIRLRGAGLNATTLAQLDDQSPADKIRLGRKLIGVITEINAMQDRLEEMG